MERVRLARASGDERDALRALVAVLGRELELLLQDVLAKEEGHAAAALLVEGHLERLRDLLLAGVVQPGEEDDEALLRARRVALAESLDDGPSCTLAK